MPPTKNRPALDASRAEKIVTELMAVPGPSCKEAAATAFIVECLRAAGVATSAIRQDDAHRKSRLGGEVGNLIVKLSGRGALRRAPRRMLSAHMDTVPICIGAKPVRRGGRIVSSDPHTGLGGDDRSGCAAILLAALAVVEGAESHPPLTFVWTVQEEVGLVGARHLDVRKLGSPAMAFNFDGGSPSEMVVGATGAARMTIRIDGLAAHAGVHPERGVSAITIASIAIARLHREGWHGLIEKGRSRGTSNVGLIEAGGATNVVTEKALLRAEARSHSPRFRERILKAYREAFERAALGVRSESGRRGKVRFEVAHDYEAFALKKSEPCVDELSRAIRAARREPTHRIVDGGLDANWLNAHGVPTVTVGAGQRDIHTVNESLDVKDFLAGCRIALALALGATRS